MEPMTYIEGFYAESADATALARADGHTIQRHCPHREADLTRFGTVTDGTLTCQMHGWQFDLTTGRCLNSAGKLQSRLTDQSLDTGLPEVPGGRG